VVTNWSLGPLVEALRGLFGVDLVSAATFIASAGDLSRFESPRLLRVSMIARGKKPAVVVTAIARELAGFIWAIGQEMRSASPDKSGASGS
jgi:hypothetical protein